MNKVSLYAWFIMPAAGLLFAISFVFYQIVGLQARNDAHLRWEKQRYMGEIAQTLCREKSVCEPLIEFKNKLQKELD